MAKQKLMTSAAAAPWRGQMGVMAETKYKAVCRDRNGKVRWRARAHNLVVTTGLNKLLDATFKTGLASPLWYIGMVGVSVSDGAMASTSSGVFTSASNPFVAGNVGAPIIVRGAGANGNDLSTTIASYQSAGQVTLTANAGTVVTGARATWGPLAADTMASHAPWPAVAAISNATRPAFTPGVIAAGAVDNSGSPAVFTVNADNTYSAGLFLTDNNTVGGATGTLYGMAVWTSGGFRQSYNTDTVTVTCTLTMTAT